MVNTYSDTEHRMSDEFKQERETKKYSGLLSSAGAVLAGMMLSVLPWILYWSDSEDKHGRQGLLPTFNMTYESAVRESIFLFVVAAIAMKAVLTLWFWILAKVGGK